ncbi:hypothetical protein EYS42_08990 [Aquabacterium lacunae]|uniref:Fibronectin type-III domain-containing protein n=1 Tax=Aquabacterium lacunae TaxID=2528630 RepID=A0A4Q9H2R3_9BURK|nr:hypothetical protein [Aquabacterium lacunae]TBO31367.1 hypothetical protein EYS42_08990 [Aquabacterium lacunae]
MLNVRISAAMVLGVLTLTSSPTFAVSLGIDPSSTPVKDPITGNDFNAWKLVGTSCASAVQIHANWIVSSQHCMPSADATFSGPYGTATVESCFRGNDTANLRQGDENDFALCRLKRPTQITYSGTFPALVAAPTPVVNHPSGFPATLSPATQRQFAVYGYLMAYGFGCCNKIGVTDFNGLLPGNDMARSTAQVVVPQLIGGDSGGAAFWVSPTAAAPALVGVLTTGYALPRGVTYFSDSSVNWIRNKIVAAGDTAPITYTASQFYTGPTAPVPPHVPAPPSLILSNGTPALTWLAPTDAGADTITGYQITVARDRNIVSTVQVTGANTQAPMPVGNHAFTACVRARNTSGLSAPGNLEQLTATPYGCRDFDLSTVSGLSQAFARDAATGLVKVTLNWQRPNQASNTRYRITRVTKQGLIQRTQTLETTSTSSTQYVQPGTSVCQRVTVFSDLNPVGTSTANVCSTAN